MNTQTKKELPVIFTALQRGDVLHVHDYLFDLETGAFDYIPDSITVHGLTLNVPGGVGFVDSAKFPVRPIVAVLEILDMLQHDVCVCGDYKPRSRSHCRPCYLSLSPEHQKALYRRFRAGYEQAFLRSLIELIAAGRTTPEKIREAVPVGRA